MPYGYRRRYGNYRRSYGYRAPVVAVGAKRQVWKICRNIQSNPTSTQQNLDLYSAADSNINRTLSGLKLQGGINFTGTGTTTCAIVRVPETQTPAPLGTASGADIYPVDEHVLWSGMYAGDSDTFYKFEVDSKAMRKMRPGDRIVFLAVSSSATAVSQIAFSYTMFLKD